MTKQFKVGDRVKYLIEHIREGLQHPYHVKRDDSRYSACLDAQLEYENAVNRESKKSLNFWEARTAALNGKRVKKVDTDTEFTIDDFMSDNYSFDNYEIKADWEIVEEPKTYTIEHVEFLPNGSIARLEIILNENGKPISAKNA